MKQPHIFLPILVITATLLSGCGTPAVSNSPPTMSRVESAPSGQSYSFTLVKSPTFKEPYKATLTPSTASMRDVLTASHVAFATVMHGQQEVMDTLGGVITTGSKTWYLYVNDKPVPVITLDSIMVAPQDHIEWRYEPLH